MTHHWLLICATKPEWSELKKKISFSKDHTYHNFNFYRAQHHEKELFLAQIGIGYDSAERMIKKFFLSTVITPELILSFGLSGALTSELNTGDLFLPQQILNQKGESLAPTPAFFEKSLELLRLLKLPYKQGTLLTSRTVLSAPLQKKEAGEKWEAQAIDMETYPIAKAAQEKGIPFLSIRAIFDPLDWDLSSLDESKTFDDEGNIKSGALTASVVAHPKLLMALPRYQKAASLGNKALAKFIEKVVET